MQMETTAPDPARLLESELQRFWRVGSPYVFPRWLELVGDQSIGAVDQAWYQKYLGTAPAYFEQLDAEFLRNLGIPSLRMR